MPAAIVALACLAQPSTGDRSKITDSSAVQTVAVNHVIWVWFENREITDITSQTAPFFTSFASANANLTNYFGVSHPSQPNYIDAFSGSNQGITNDNHFTLSATTNNLAKQLSTAGKTWRVYAQDFPGSCFDGDTFNGGTDGPGVAGQYVRKHNPAMTFQSVSLNSTECANVQPLASFDPTVNFALVVPNMINDMHDGTTAQGDAFLQAFVPLVTASSDFAHTLLIVTFDEGSSNLNGGGHVYTAAAAPWLHNATISTTYNHFNLLRTTEDIFGLTPLGSAATAVPIIELLPPTQQRAPFDFDGDGKTDVSIFRPSDATWWFMKSSNGQVLAAQFGAGTDKVVAADYTGDGKTDIAFFRSSTGQWFVLRSEDGSFFALPFGTNGDIPMPADYDGDGKADVAVFRPSSGTWFILRSSDGQVSFIQFGTSGDQPVAADYDADGKADVAIYRPNGAIAGAAEWWVQRSTAGLMALQFGSSTDKAVPGDFTGDGKTDVAVFRPATSQWFVLRSEDFSFFAFPWGQTGDITAPGDYDGDGKTDAAIFRPSNSTWFVSRTTAGPLIVGFGLPTDQPVPNAYVR